MFIGRYYYQLEEKGRVSLPKVFRETTDDWIVTRGLDGGLFVFPAEGFEQRLADLPAKSFTKKTNRDFVRLMVNDAKSVSPDNNGRILLPDYLIELAQLQKQVVIVGSLTYLEIWDQERYHAYLDQLGPQAETIAENLEENDAHQRLAD